LTIILGKVAEEDIMEADMVANVEVRSGKIYVTPLNSPPDV
jgi:hypothetical protein